MSSSNILYPGGNISLQPEFHTHDSGARMHHKYRTTATIHEYTLLDVCKHANLF